MAGYRKLSRVKGTEAEHVERRRRFFLAAIEQAATPTEKLDAVVAYVQFVIAHSEPEVAKQLEDEAVAVMEDAARYLQEQRTSPPDGSGDGTPS